MGYDFASTMLTHKKLKSERAVELWEQVAKVQEEEL